MAASGQTLSMAPEAAILYLRASVGPQRANRPRSAIKCRCLFSWILQPVDAVKPGHSGERGGRGGTGPQPARGCGAWAGSPEPNSPGALPVRHFAGKDAARSTFSPRPATRADPNVSAPSALRPPQLFMQRIIRLGGAVDDDMANLIVAQLLYLDSEDPKRDVTLYINSPGGSVTAGMAVFDTMRHVRPDVSTVCGENVPCAEAHACDPPPALGLTAGAPLPQSAWQPPWGRFCSRPGRRASATRSPTPGS